MQRLISDHGDVTLMLRDRPSEQFARAHFEARVVLAPGTRPWGWHRSPGLAGAAFADVLWLHRLAGDPEYVDHGVRSGWSR